MAGRVPEFQITLKVEFDGDVNVGQIADIVKIKSTLCQSYRDAGYTRIGHKKLPAAWWYAYPSPREYKPGWKLNERIEEFFDLFSPDGLASLSDFVRRNGGSVALAVNIYFFRRACPGNVYMRAGERFFISAECGYNDQYE